MRVVLIAIFAAMSTVPASAKNLFHVSTPFGDLAGLLRAATTPEYAIWGTAIAGLLITGSALRRRRLRMPQATD